MHHPTQPSKARSLTTTLGLLLAGGAACGVAQADTIDAQALEEVVVTARGRVEELQKVPDSITAFTSADIAARRIQSAQDIASATPGVFMVRDENPGANIISVRGVSTHRNQAGSIAFVVDGVALADTDLFTTDLVGLERVEVLKGPQGALYGKNAIGGVFNVVTRAPEAQTHAYLNAGIGNGNSYAADGLLTGALGRESVRGLLTASYRDTDGFIRNSTVDRDADFYQSKNVRGRLVIDVTSALHVDLRGNWMDEHGGAGWQSLFDATHLTGGRLVPSRLPQPASDYLGSSARDWHGGSAKIDFEAAHGTFTSISGYDNYSKTWEGDLDSLPIALIQPIGQPVDLEILTQELRYTSTGDSRLRWIAGVFYQNTERDRTDFFSRALPIPDFQYRTKSVQTAGFGQASYDVTERLELTAALRFDQDDRDETTSIRPSSAAIRSLSAVYEKWQPKVSLSYALTPSHMIYATYAVGFKTGGFNPEPSPGDIFTARYAAESTRQYEAGAKTRWADGRLVANVAAFVIEYSNKQEFVFSPSFAQAVFNVPDTDIKGFELQLAAQPVTGLKIEAAVGYTDAQFGAFSVTNFLGPQDFGGNNVPYTPSYGFNLGVQTEHHLKANGLTARLRADYGGTARVYWEQDNLLYTPSHQWLDARFVLEAPHWTLAAWAKNLTNERWAVSAFGQNQVSLLNTLGADMTTLNTGRQFGLTASLSW